MYFQEWVLFFQRQRQWWVICPGRALRQAKLTQVLRTPTREAAAAKQHPCCCCVSQPDLRERALKFQQQQQDWKLLAAVPTCWSIWLWNRCCCCRQSSRLNSFHTVVINFQKAAQKCWKNWRQLRFETQYKFSWKQIELEKIYHDDHISFRNMCSKVLMKLVSLNRYDLYGQTNRT